MELPAFACGSAKASEGSPGNFAFPASAGTASESAGVMPSIPSGSFAWVTKSDWSGSMGNWVDPGAGANWAIPMLWSGGSTCGLHPTDRVRPLDPKDTRSMRVVADDIRMQGCVTAGSGGAGAMVSPGFTTAHPHKVRVTTNWIKGFMP